MTLKLLEEAASKGMKDDDILKSLLWEIYQQLIVVEKLAKDKSISSDPKADLEGIKTKLTLIEASVNRFPTAEKVIAISLSKITPVLEKLTSEISEAIL